MDLEILRRAREAGTRIAYLEPREHQLALLEKVMTIEMLADFLDDVDGLSTRETASGFLCSNSTSAPATCSSPSARRT